MVCFAKTNSLSVQLTCLPNTDDAAVKYVKSVPVGCIYTVFAVWLNKSVKLGHFRYMLRTYVITVKFKLRNLELGFHNCLEMFLYGHNI